MTACSTSSSKTVDPPMSAEGPAAFVMPATMRRAGIDSASTAMRASTSHALPPCSCTGAATETTPGTAATRRATACRVARDDDVHRRGEPRAGEGLSALGRDPDLGVARELVEPAVERLHGDERRRDRDQHAGAGGERDDRMAHDRTRPARPEHVASLLRRPPRQPDAQPVDPRAGRGEQRREQGRRREHGDADDDDRAERHRPQGGDVDGEQRGERHRDRRAAEDDGGAGARERAAECLLLGRSLAELAAEPADDEERVVDGDADPDHRRHVRDVHGDLERTGEPVDDGSREEDRRESERERRRGGRERAEGGEQDEEDEREAELLAARELVLRGFLEVRPDGRLADQPSCARRRAGAGASSPRRSSSTSPPRSSRAGAPRVRRRGSRAVRPAPPDRPRGSAPSAAGAAAARSGR